MGALEKKLPSESSTIPFGRLFLKVVVRFFLFNHLLACDLTRSWRDYVQSVSCPLSARWRPVRQRKLTQGARRRNGSSGNARSGKTNGG